MAELAATPGDRAQHARRRNLARVLRPRHVAVIGGTAAAEAARQLDLIGFQGPVWPVNPARAELAGRKCRASLRDLPEPPDAAVVAVPAARCPEVYAELAAVGAGGGICFAAGFAEDGHAALEAELVAAAGETALVGPNCHGILNYLDDVALWPDDHCGEPVARGFAFISQSGNVALSATFHRRSLPLAYVVGTGNQAQLDVGDFIDVLLDDPRVDAIGLFIEGLKDVGRFARAARRALERGVPIVALKVGASAEGARASMSHTAALTGADAVYDALFARLGVPRVETLAELMETLKLLCVTGPMAGRRVLSLSCSGGEAALMGDLMHRAGLEMPPPSAAGAERVAEAFHIPAASVGNPLDYNTAAWGDAAATAAGFAPALAENHDMAVLVLDFPRAERCDPRNWRAALDGLIQARERVPAPAAVLSSLPEAFPQDARQACLAAGIAPLQGLAEGVAALAHAADYGARRPALLDEPPWPGPIAEATPNAGTSLDEAAGKRLLARHGLTIPEGRLTDAADAPALAAELGFPVAVKAVGPDIPHKSELGALALDLADAEAVGLAVRRIAARLAEAGRAPTGWLVERQVTDTAAELIVGVVRDPTAGLVLVVGNGGVLAELLRETRTLLLPTHAGAVRRALESLTAGAILAGYRGGPGGDLAAAVQACLDVARFAEAHADRLVELDVNPLLVRPPGQGAVAADALVRLAA